jgi:hypothetical protein
MVASGQANPARRASGGVRWVRSMLAHGAESLLAVVLVLAFFLAFWAILSLSFPKGPTLTDLLAAEAFPFEGGTGAVEDRSDFAEDDEPGEAIAALLSRTRRSVKDKPADAIDWRPARAGSLLENGHAVQTFDRSAAVISFDEGSDLELGENSLVVLRSWKQMSRGRKRRASLIVLNGTLQGKVAVPGEEAIDLEILAATGAARIEATAAGGEQTEFRVQVNQDGSSTISLYEGDMAIATEEGRIQLDENRSLTLTPEGDVGTLQTLPARPRIEAPRPGTVVSYRTLPPSVRFRWQPVEGAERYHFLIARDPAFRDVVHEARPTEPEFRHGNLTPGEYHWRVTSIRGSLEGRASEPARLRMMEDRTPPALSVRFPEGIVKGRGAVLTGRTEPGTAVFVGRQKVNVRDSGEFEHRVSLEPGINVLTVEAVDAAGNVAYRSQMVNAKF